MPVPCCCESVGSGGERCTGFGATSRNGDTDLLNLLFFEFPLSSAPRKPLKRIRSSIGAPIAIREAPVMLDRLRRRPGQSRRGLRRRGMPRKSVPERSYSIETRGCTRKVTLQGSRSWEASAQETAFINPRRLSRDATILRWHFRFHGFVLLRFLRFGGEFSPDSAHGSNTASSVNETQSRFEPPKSLTKWPSSIFRLACQPRRFLVLSVLLLSRSACEASGEDVVPGHATQKRLRYSRNRLVSSEDRRRRDSLTRPSFEGKRARISGRSGIS